MASADNVGLERKDMSISPPFHRVNNESLMMYSVPALPLASCESNFVTSKSNLVWPSPPLADGLTKFSLFPRLPTELQLKIWGFAACIPRILEIYHVYHNALVQRNHISPNSRQPPSVLHVCHQSRSEALRFYRLRNFGLTRSFGRENFVYYNPRVDIVYFGDREDQKRYTALKIILLRSLEIPRVALIRGGVTARGWRELRESIFENHDIYDEAGTDGAHLPLTTTFRAIQEVIWVSSTVVKPLGGNGAPVYFCEIAPPVSRMCLLGCCEDARPDTPRFRYATHVFSPESKKISRTITFKLPSFLSHDAKRYMDDTIRTIEKKTGCDISIDSPLKRSGLFTRKQEMKLCGTAKQIALAKLFLGKGKKNKIGRSSKSLGACGRDDLELYIEKELQLMVPHENRTSLIAAAAAIAKEWRQNGGI